jgi:predicted transposase YbfD/YdcC
LPKKTVETIVKTGNDYIVQVKGNQKNLLEQVKINTASEKHCVSFFVDEYNARGRKEIRETFIYEDLTDISSEWVGLKRLIRVERTVITKKRHTHETAYYISSARSNKAEFFANHIRNHWGIENRLHWVKDVSMNEDKSKTTGGMAAENISVLRNIVINLFKTNKYNSIKYAMEVCNNNFRELEKLTGCNSVTYKIT